MASQSHHSGREILRRALAGQRGLIAMITLLSGVTSLLMLTGPIYMLNIYNRVISTHSHHTLIVLSGLAVYLYVIMGALDYVRGRLLARMAARFHSALPTAFLVGSAASNTPPHKAADRLRMAIDSPTATALFDLPWAPIYFAGLFVLHPWLGWFGIAGACAGIGLASLGRIAARQAEHLAIRERALANDLASHAAQPESQAAIGSQWRRLDIRAMRLRLRVGDLTGLSGAFGKSLRMMLQSGALGLGALLVLRAEISPGAMLAASILMGRAMGPINALITQWPMMQQARQDWLSLASITHPIVSRAPPPNNPDIVLQDVTYVPPNGRAPVLRQISASLKAGQSVAILGGSGAGKSTLLRLIAGIGKPNTGAVMVAGGQAHRIKHSASPITSYLPQDGTLHAGSLLENIVGIVETADQSLIRCALEKSGVNVWIQQLPEGIDTLIESGGANLSHSQRQQVRLARAYYANSPILILDDPFNASDHHLMAQFTELLRSRNAANAMTIVATRDPNIARQCDTIIQLHDGRMTAPPKPLGQTA